MDKAARLYVVSSSGENGYAVTFETHPPDYKLTIDCDCPAGRRGILCKHKMELIKGDTSIYWKDRHPKGFPKKQLKTIQNLVSTYGVTNEVHQLEEELKNETDPQVGKNWKNRLARLMREGFPYPGKATDGRKGLEAMRKDSHDFFKTITPKTVNATKERKRNLFPGFHGWKDGALQGRAEGWAFFIDHRFKRCLDISLTSRVVLTNDTPLKRWTQGSNFNFDTGVTIYDTQQGYSRWDKASQAIKQYIQIIESIPALAAHVVIETWNTYPENLDERTDYWSGKGIKTSTEDKLHRKKPEFCLKAYIPRDKGMVRFNLCTPDRKQEKETQQFSTTQDAFIEFLINGDTEKLSR
ncbi:MAG: hypothetical protein CL942_14215 [Desulfovibrio sp.]|nr:hypothetical protein [Desulfovibrio sp.]|tara:strand:- start:2024 stop:3082 length:1059 start_codon:yes stop_codon:yes gene_type:complete